MNYLMYSVKDEMTGKFMNPMFVAESDTSDIEATRQFRSNVLNIQLWKDNPSDFNLYRVGRFSDVDGASITTLDKVASGRSFIDGKD